MTDLANRCKYALHESAMYKFSAEQSFLALETVI